jgi:hypothetical protein
VKVIPIVIISILLTGAFTSSCRHYPTAPNDSTKCDTCCDTCHTDTTHHPPCDTCNIDKDSLAHAFNWTEYTISGESNLTGCWIFGDTDIRIMGNYFYKFNGATFIKLSAYNLTRSKEMGGGLNGYNIFGFDRDDYWLISGSGSRAYHSAYDTRFEEFNPGNTNSCWGPSSNDMFVVGNGGQIHHYDGTKFTDMVSGTTKRLSSVWGTSHNDVWATGYNSSTDESILLHYDGNSWTEDDFSTSGQTREYGIGNVWATDSAGHRLAVISGTYIFRKTDNGSWRKDTSDLHNGLGGHSYVSIAAYGGTPDNMIAAGGWGYISHWNGKTWHWYDKFFDYSNAIYGAAAMSIKGNIACVVGIKSGQSWVAIGRRKQ